MVSETDVLVWTQQAFAGNADAAFSLGVYLNLQGHLDDALPYYEMSADAGKHEAMAYLAWVHKMRGDVDQAEAWGRRAVESGNLHAADMLLTLRDPTDTTAAGVVRAAARAAAVGAAELGLDGKAEEQWGIAADYGDLESMLVLGFMAEDREEFGHALLYFERADRLGAPGSAEHQVASEALADLIHKLGRR